MTDKEQITEMASIINDEKDVCVRMQGLMDCKYCTCKNKNGECVFAEYISRTLFMEGCRMQDTEKNSDTQWHKVADGDLPKKSGYYYCHYRGVYMNTGEPYEANNEMFWNSEKFITSSSSKVIAWTELPKYKE